MFCIFSRDQHLNLGPKASLKTIIHGSCPTVPTSHCPTSASSYLIHYDFSFLPSCDLKLSLGTDLILWALSEESQAFEVLVSRQTEIHFAACCLLSTEIWNEATLHAPSMSKSQQDKQPPITAWAVWFWMSSSTHDASSDGKRGMGKDGKLSFPFTGSSLAGDMGRTTLSLLVMMRSTTKVLSLWGMWGQEHLQLQTACQRGVFHCPDILLSYSDCHGSAPSPAGDGIDLSRHLRVFSVLRREGRKERRLQTCLFGSDSLFSILSLDLEGNGLAPSQYAHPQHILVIPCGKPTNVCTQDFLKLTFFVKSKQWPFQSLLRFSLNSNSIIAKYVFANVLQNFHSGSQFQMSFLDMSCQ